MPRKKHVAFLQVHTRHAKCISGTVTCNCAVAVREGNDILGINACNGPPTAIRYLRDPNTPDGKAAITRPAYGSYKVYMLIRVQNLRLLH